MSAGCRTTKKIKIMGAVKRNTRNCMGWTHLCGAVLYLAEYFFDCHF